MNNPDYEVKEISYQEFLKLLGESNQLKVKNQNKQRELRLAAAPVLGGANA